MVYSIQDIKIVNQSYSIFSHHFCSFCENFSSQYILGGGVYKFNNELLPTKCSGFKLKFPKVKNGNISYDSISSVGVLFHKKNQENSNFQIAVSLFYAHDPNFLFIIQIVLS